MGKVVKRRWYYNFEKEENWLNEMAEKGLNLVKYSFLKYTFEEGEKDQYIYRIQYVGYKNEEEADDYFQFMAENDVELITYEQGWAIFRREKTKGPFHIFTDRSSKLKHYKTIVKTFAILAAVNLFLGLFNLMFYEFNRYISIVSFTVVILLVVVISNYMKRINELNKEDLS